MEKTLENIVEALIFASPEGISTKEITRCVRAAVATARENHGEDAPEEITQWATVDEVQIKEAIRLLNRFYEESGRAFLLSERAAGWRIMSRQGYAPWVRELFPDRKPQRLTQSALETLAIIAYRQPVTRASMEAVRGVAVDGPVQTLLDKNIIRIAGRADLPGRPLLYETTDLFLEHFGIQSVDELPNARELRAVRLPEPEIPEAKPDEKQGELPLAGSAAPEGGAKSARKKEKARAAGSAPEREEEEAPAPAPEAGPASGNGEGEAAPGA